MKKRDTTEEKRPRTAFSAAQLARLKVSICNVKNTLLNHFNKASGKKD